MASDTNFIAKTNFRKKEQIFGIKRTDRRQHMYVIGKTGVGKSAFLKNMALQDIKNGEGLAIIDPHGEFVEEILDNIPQERMKDVVYFNPADTEYPVSFNILEVSDPRYKHLVASGLIGIFTKIWANVWSARMEYILANCVLALLDTPGTTLLGIPRMLVDRDYRQKIINNLKDPVVKSFWLNEYEEWDQRYRNEAIAPVQNKVGQFLNVSLVRNIVGQSKNTINIEDIMNTGKILLVNVSKGRVGEDNSAILGAMLITKIQLSAMERVRIPENERKDFYLYVDEFQNFATDSFVNILSEARKYRLNLIIAHQYIGQLITETTTAVRDAVFGNIGTLVSFRVGAADAEFLEQEFSPEFTLDDLVILPNYNVYLKLMIDGVSSRPFSAKTIPPDESSVVNRNRDEIIRLSRRQYSKSRFDAEREITQWAGNTNVEEVMLRPTGKKSQSQSQSVTLYDAICSNCGKPTKVTFEPSKDKPVYCKSCFKKFRGGDKKKTESSETTESPETEDSFDSHDVSYVNDVKGGGEDLGMLGIEFEQSKSSKSKPAKIDFSLNQTKDINKDKEELDVKVSNVPFKSPKKDESFSKPRKKEINLSDLKKAVEESLVKAEKEKEEKKKDEPKVKEDAKISNKTSDFIKENIEIKENSNDSPSVTEIEKPMANEPKVEEKEEKKEESVIVEKDSRDDIKEGREEAAQPKTEEKNNEKKDGDGKKVIMSPGQKIKL